LSVIDIYNLIIQKHAREIKSTFAVTWN
jgi:hypothetical protein